MRADERAVWDALEEVADPEIPVLSVVDLGIVHRVATGGDRIQVTLLPTFVGCPAIDLMRAAVTERLAGMAGRIDVDVTFDQPWTSDRITAEGRRKLRGSGFAPPAPRPLEDPPALDLGLRSRRPVACPWCGSRETRLENPFGPTLCRAIHWCPSCRQPFEEFKTI